MRSASNSEKAAGRNLKIDYAVMQSDTLTGNRNRAIAHLMRNFGIIDEQVNETLHQYFAQCSMRVTCQDVATMAARLAHMGTNPTIGKQVFDFQF